MKVTLSTLYNGKPRYFIIGKTKQNHFHVTRRGFDSIPEMVSYYMATREPLHENLPVVIKRPVAHPVSRQALSAMQVRVLGMGDRARPHPSGRQDR